MKKLMMAVLAAFSGMLAFGEVVVEVSTLSELQNAVNRSDNPTIKLTDHIDYGTTQFYWQSKPSFTLDLNGHNLTGTGLFFMGYSSEPALHPCKLIVPHGSTLTTGLFRFVGDGHELVLGGTIKTSGTAYVGWAGITHTKVTFDYSRGVTDGFPSAGVKYDGELAFEYDVSTFTGLDTAATSTMTANSKVIKLVGDIADGTNADWGTQDSFTLDLNGYDLTFSGNFYVGTVGTPATKPKTLVIPYGSTLKTGEFRFAGNGNAIILGGAIDVTGSAFFGNDTVSQSLTLDFTDHFPVGGEKFIHATAGVYVACNGSGVSGAGDVKIDLGGISQEQVDAVEKMIASTIFESDSSITIKTGTTIGDGTIIGKSINTGVPAVGATGFYKIDNKAVCLVLKAEDAIITKSQFDNAISSLTAGKVVKLGVDMDYTAIDWGTKPSFTFDLNGHDFTVSGTFYLGTSGGPAANPITLKIPYGSTLTVNGGIRFIGYGHRLEIGGRFVGSAEAYIGKDYIEGNKDYDKIIPQTIVYDLNHGVPAHSMIEMGGLLAIGNQVTLSVGEAVETDATDRYPLVSAGGLFTFNPILDIPEKGEISDATFEGKAAKMFHWSDKAVRIGAVKYATIAEAVTAVRGGETLTLINNAAYEGNINWGGKPSFTLDLNGYAFTVNGQFWSGFNGTPDTNAKTLIVPYGSVMTVTDSIRFIGKGHHLELGGRIICNKEAYFGKTSVDAGQSFDDFEQTLTLDFSNGIPEEPPFFAQSAVGIGPAMTTTIKGLNEINADKKIVLASSATSTAWFDDSKITPEIKVANASDKEAYILVFKEDPFSGIGSSSDPFRIAGATDMATLADKVAAGIDFAGYRFAQAADITLTDWAGIGDNNEGNGAVKAFAGNFAGSGKKITVQFANDMKYIGIFNATTNATISGMKVEVENGAINGAGGVVGFAGDGTQIDGVTVAGVFNGAHNIGGIAVKTDGDVKIRNCTVSADIKTQNKAGGMVGFAQKGPLTIEKCAFSGTITSTKSDAAVGDDRGIGGIIGWAKCDVELVDCVMTGSLVWNEANAVKGAIIGGFGAHEGDPACTLDIVNCVYAGNAAYGEMFNPAAAVDEPSVAVKAGNLTVKIPDSQLDGFFGGEKPTAEELTAERTEGNGIPLLDCYVLGLNKDNAASKPLVNKRDASAGKLKLGLDNVTVNTASGVTPKFTLKASSDNASFAEVDGQSGKTESEFEIDLPSDKVKYYKIEYSFE